MIWLGHNNMNLDFLCSTLDILLFVVFFLLLVVDSCQMLPLSALYHNFGNDFYGPVQYCYIDCNSKKICGAKHGLKKIFRTEKGLLNCVFSKRAKFCLKNFVKKKRAKKIPKSLIKFSCWWDKIHAVICIQTLKIIWYWLCL